MVYAYDQFDESVPEEESSENQRLEWKRWQGVVPKYIRSACFFWQFIKFTYTFYLCTRQHRVLNENRSIPPVLAGKLSQATFARARSYNKALNYLQMFSCLYWVGHEFGMIMFAGYTGIWFLGVDIVNKLGFWPAEWDHEIGDSIVFVSLLIIHINTVKLPLNLWKTFVIEEKYGFNKMSFGSYMLDWLKFVLIEGIYAVITGILILEIVKETGRFFFIWLCTFSFVWLVLTAALYPNLIAPIFDSYTQLRQGRLKIRLKRLANFLGFPLDDILVLHQSWRSEHRRAYLFGLFTTKKIVLYDTLLAGYPEADDGTSILRRKSALTRERTRVQQGRHRESGSAGSDDHIPSRIVQRGYVNTTGRNSDDVRNKESEDEMGFTEYEIEAIVARLMGHWLLGHSVKEFVLACFSLFLFYAVFALLYQNSSLFEAFSVPKDMDKPILLGLRMLYSDVMDIYKYIIESRMKYLKRQQLFEADSFATKLGYGDDLIEAYIESEKENLEYPYFDKMYWDFHNNEPPVLECISAIEREIELLEWKVD